MRRTDLWMPLGLAALFLVMAASFVGLPWATGQEPVPVSVAEGAPGQTVAGSLFGEYVVTLPLIALLLGTCMIGGIYLAKQEEEE